MIGITFELRNNGVRFYTAHLKQCSVNSKDVIQDQFVEIKSQFRHATESCEAMLMIFDANVHVGGKWINGCCDQEDWGGKILMEMITNESLSLINNMELCDGIVTRIDPRNGTCTTIDLAICNSFMLDKLTSMHIDEVGLE